MTEVKTLVQDFVLLCYDISAKAGKARYQILKKLDAMGAIQYTESVYLVPYSAATMAVAEQLAGEGHVVVWKSHQPSEKKAMEITLSYEKHLQMRCAVLQDRLETGQEYMALGKLKTALKMGQKTLKMLQELSDISQSYHPQWFLDELGVLVKLWGQIYQSKGES